MTWLALLSSGISLTLILVNVQPLWIQYVGFCVALSLFIMVLARSFSLKGVVGTWFKKRGLILAALFFIVVISILARRYETVIDFSRYQAYSLRDQTVAWLKKIKEPIRILVFLSSDDKTVGLARWLQKQFNEHTPHIKIEIKNINKDIQLARRYGVEHVQETVLVSKDQWTKVGDFKEQTLVPGIMRLLAKTSMAVCFLTGHGEPDVNDMSEKGLSVLNEFLTNLGYRVRAVALDESDATELERSCGVLMVIGPRTAFLPVEGERLDAIIKRGSLPVFFALDLPVPDTVKEILEKEGLRLRSQLVMNRKNPLKRMPATDIVLYSQPTVITGDLHGRFYLPEVQALEIADAKETNKSIVWHPFLVTPPVFDFYLMGRKEVSGPYVLGVYGLNDNEPKSVVIGTARAFLGRQVMFGANKNLVLAVIRWLLKEERMAWIEAPLHDEPVMEISSAQEFWIKNTAMYGLPGLAFVVSFFYWFGRRVKG